MKFEKLPLEGAYLIEPDKIIDHRGFFGRIWCEKEFSKFGLKTNLVQSNVSFSKKKGTLRGLHFQRQHAAETKLVRCTRGRIFDVIVDLRPKSRTFKKWFGAELSSENMRMVYVPENFAHGFITLEDNTEIYYLVTEFYNRELESGLRYNDPELAIDWPIEVKEISEKDNSHLDFKLENIL